MKTKNAFSKPHLIFTVILGLSLCVFTYLIARSVSFRLGFSSKAEEVLSSETKKILDAFGTDKIVAYSFFSNAQPQKETMENLLSKFARASSSFHFEMIDPDKSPSKAREFQIDSYGVTIIKARGREMRFESVDEQDVSVALGKILSKFKRTIYVVTGHGEPKLNDKKDEGYLSLHHLLSGRGYEVKKLEFSKNETYKDADLLVLAGPHTDLSSKELGVLESYLNSGGKLFLALDPVYEGEGDNLKSFLIKYGIELGSDVIVDKLGREMSGDYLVAMATDFDGKALNGFHQAALFPVARSIKKYREIPGGWSVMNAVKTSLGSWAETDLKGLEDGKADYNEGVDFPGPISIGVTAEEDANKKKIAVIGDSDFLSNAHIHIAGNYHLTTRIFSWLLDDALPGESAAESNLFQPFDFPHAKQTLIFYFSVVILPIIIFLIGLLLYLSRKRFV